MNGDVEVKSHLRTYWWVWLLIATAVVTANELIDRLFFDEYHVAADIFLASVAVAVASFGSYLVARRR
jgi:hypothetical protein